jgi:hypothetical protein
MGLSYVGHFKKQKRFNCIVIMAYKLLISRYINHQLSYFAQGLALTLKTSNIPNLT